MDRVGLLGIMQRRIFIFSTILALMRLFGAEQLNADIYQWVDGNGVKHFSNAPPVNAENAQIVFDEHQLDTAANENRVKTDQKTLDALIEEIKKEEQQAKVNMEKQKKIMNVKQFHQSLFGSKCFGPSYSIQQGRSVRHGIVARYLMPGEFEDLQELFESLKGEWYGAAWERTCKNIKGEVYQEINNFTVKSEGRMPTSGQFFLKSNIYSRESNSSRLEALPLYLDPKKLTAQEGISVSDLELISVSSDHLVYVQKGAPLLPGINDQTAPRKDREREFVTTIKKTGKNSFSYERFFYIRGKLKTTNTWYLENN
ncbi:MAG: DUF4124 domain-containing protein [Desulfobacterales bacterium]|jgi:hypothetical protein